MAGRPRIVEKHKRLGSPLCRVGDGAVFCAGGGGCGGGSTPPRHGGAAAHPFGGGCEGGCGGGPSCRGVGGASPATPHAGTPFHLHGPLLHAGNPHSHGAVQVCAWRVHQQQRPPTAHVHLQLLDHGLEAASRCRLCAGGVMAFARAGRRDAPPPSAASPCERIQQLRELPVRRQNDAVGRLLILTRKHAEQVSMAPARCWRALVQVLLLCPW